MQDIEEIGKILSKIIATSKKAVLSAA